VLAPPQQARAVATRARLIDAAGAVLIEGGLRGTTTAAVAARAGVSQGALFKHFPTKVDLLAASTERVLLSLVEAFRDAIPARPPAGLDARVKLGVAALWSVFRLPGMHGLFEVYLAARNEPALGKALEPLLVAHRENILREARALMPELAESEALVTGVDAVVYAMQGVALGVFSNDARREREHLAFFERLAAHELEVATTETARTETRRSRGR
jgi:AcrR family transcriptional regulator